ncbi:MAG: hypothetical protein JNJ70_20995 [Verrucomicrobiales bacterium]|nr:hypothetical protein [Verrucomicrobiales bacterium]
MDEIQATESAGASQASPRYDSPPVIRRVAVLFGEMTGENFEASRAAWKSQVQPDFPFEDPLVQWRLNMEEEDGVPRLDKIQPELKITDRFYRKREDKGKENQAKPDFDFSMRCPLGRLELHMGSWPGSQRSFSNLRGECERWFGAWSKTFRLEQPTKVLLHYVNLLRKDVTPELFDENGALALGETLSVFAGVPGEHAHLEPPFDCKVGLRLNGVKDGKMRIHVVDASAETGNSAVAIRVHLFAEAGLEPGEGVDKALTLLDWCHERIVERFELIFTAKAKQSFQPVPR